VCWQKPNVLDRAVDLSAMVGNDKCKISFSVVTCKLADFTFEKLKLR